MFSMLVDPKQNLVLKSSQPPSSGAIGNISFHLVSSRYEKTSRENSSILASITLNFKNLFSGGNMRVSSADGEDNEQVFRSQVQ